MLTIYCARPISGCSFSDVFAYYDALVPQLSEMGYRVLWPMIGKDHLRTREGPAPALGYEGPLGDFAIPRRDRWMIRQSNIVYVDLSGTTEVSMGCLHELAWGRLLERHMVLAMEAGNPHEHIFVLEAADVRYESADEALDYLSCLPT